MEPAAIRTGEEMLRALHFPKTGTAEALWLLKIALALAALVWLGAWVSRRLRRAPAAIPLPMEPHQKRRDFRVSVDLSAEILPERAREPLQAHLLDLSAGGTSLMAQADLPPGSRLGVRFTAPGERTEERIAAEVVGSEPAPPPHGGHVLHCRFLRLDAEQERHLRRLVAARERETLRNR